MKILIRRRPRQQYVALGMIKIRIFDGVINYSRLYPLTFYGVGVDRRHGC